MQTIESKAPFSQYASLPGVDVVYGNPADPRTYPEGGFDIVYDNNGKSLKECQALIDTYASKVRHSSFPLQGVWAFSSLLWQPFPDHER
jgi:hypothetical protein